MPDRPNRVLLIRPSALGDVCRTVPVLASLRNAFPDAAIDWLVQDTFADAIRHHPALDDIVTFPRATFSKWWKPRVAAEVRSWLRQLKARNYDLVLDCQGLARSGVFTRATKAPVRIGYQNAAEFGWLALNQRVSAPMTNHTVDRMLALADAAGATPIRDMTLYTDPGADRWAADRIASDRHAILAPTSRWPGKLWPIDRFVIVAHHLLEHDVTPVVVGSSGERSQCAPLIDTPGVVDLVGETSIAQLMSLIKGASIVIALDSAALHMAVGFDKPIVALYGPTQVERVGPYRRDQDVIQHIEPGDVLDHKNEGIGQRMMSRITTGEVIERVAALLQQHAGRPA